ncbi:MAG: glycerol-3-phosphate 1-O-acyltransferase PlsY [Chloroflexi bacterium]|nr:glycerol-3-phosphate 1-O-acyltransferase PlsY [Chloroflexota bacterium]
MSLEAVVQVLAITYLIGSIPTAYIIGRFKGINIFEIGSGNMGANNTARALGIQWGVVVWLLDGFKGIIALLIAGWLASSTNQAAAWVVGAIGVVLGHNWSLFATMLTGHVRGGKGAATASGTWVLLVPPILLAGVLMIWALVVFLTRYMSLAVLTSVAVVSLYIVALAVLDHRDPIFLGYILVAVMIFYRHRTNIRAIMAGTERRFGDRAEIN